MLKKYYKYIVVFFVLYFVWAVAVPLTFKVNIKNIERLIERFSGYRVELTNPRLSTASVLRAKISADEVSIIDGAEKPLCIKRPRLNIKTLPLLIGKPRIRTFECEKINSNLSIKDNHLYLGNYLIQLPEKNIDTKIDRIKIKDYDINCLDTQSNMGINFKGRDFYFKETYRNIFAGGNNRITIGDSESTAIFDIRIPRRNYIRTSKINLDINNLDVKPLTNILRTFVKSEILSLDGKININSGNTHLDGNIDGFKLIMKDSAKTIIFPEKFIIDSDFVLKSNTLNISNFNISGENIGLAIKGSIKNFTSSKPNFDLDINMPKSDVRQIALLLPPIVVPQFNVYRLKMYPFYGYSEAKLRIKGKFPEPNMDGNIRISEAYLIKPIPNADKANININCVGKKMNLDVVVPAGGKETVYITGEIEDYGDNKADLKIKSTQNVDLEIAEFVLNPLHEVLRFLLGPVPIMDIKGRGNANLRIIGTKKDPHIWGDFNFVNTSARFIDLHHLVLENASGNLHFYDQDAHFINKTGTVNNQPFTVDGKCNLFGNLDFDVIGNNQPLQNLIDVIKDSPMLDSIKPIVPDIKQAKGNTDLRVNLTGKLPNIYDIRLNENLIIKGSVNLKDNALILENIPFKCVRGLINFYKTDLDLNLSSILDDNSEINITGNVKNNIANILLSSDRLNIREFTKEKLKELDDCYIKFRALYKGTLDKIDLSKLECKGNIIKNNSPIKNIKVQTGSFELKHSRLKLSNITGFIKHNPFNIDLTINNINSTDIKKYHANGNISVKNFDLTTLNYLKNIDIFPYIIQRELRKLNINQGNSDIRLNIKNNNINGGFSLNNINGVYNLQKTPESQTPAVPIKLINGEVVIKNNRIFLNKMNYLVDNMPVLVYGNFDNIFRTPKFNIHINSKLSQKTFDKYWNVDNIYPIKVKGDILLGSLISGTSDKFNTRLDLKMEENSSIYYMGATVGDPEHAITVNSDFDIIKNNIVRLNSFRYNKLITSQNNKQNLWPLLTMKGGITYYNNKYYTFDNLVLKTDSPTDARIFNVLFKKPTIKHGQFTSDLKINGKSTSPKILGELVINGLDMPFLSTIVKDLSMNFDEKNVFIQSKGEILSNNIIFNAKMKNKFSSNYEIQKADISMKHLDINSLMTDLKQMELKTFNDNTDSSQVNTNVLNSVIIDDLNINADNLTIKNLKAKNLIAKCALNDKMQFSVDKYHVDISDGDITGDVKYNLLNNLLKLSINADNVDANELLTALFDLPNQIYGSLTGKINIVSNVTNDKTSKETLSGRAVFTVQDGKMPKLGSLEYMLKAGNVIKSGITGITMNSILDLMTPLKTGEFSSIDGNIYITNGIADKIEIHSKSKDLNLFIKGKYNLITKVADMTVLGQLSRKVSTAFGTVGNISLNSLFNKIPGINLNENSQLINELNKIPGIELSNNTYRKFVVEIYGDINNNNNVKSFKWIEKN